MSPTIQELRTPSAARVEAEQCLAEAQAQCDAAAKKLEAARAECINDPSLANFRNRAKAERELEPYADFLAERQKEAKAALAFEHEQKRADIPSIYTDRLIELQRRLLGRALAIEELNKETAKALAELDLIADEFDRETAEFAQVASEIGGALPAGFTFQLDIRRARRFSARDVAHALLPKAETILGLPVSALECVQNVTVAANVRGQVEFRRKELAHLKASLPVVKLDDKPAAVA
jgi:hypothetical protein